MAGAGFQTFDKLRAEMCRADLGNPRGVTFCGLPQEK
jgi:hypothetical protein